MSKRQNHTDGGGFFSLERCPRCNIHFATTTLDSTADVLWPLPVPISCLVCASSTLCKLCVDKVDQCSACGSASATCFDKNVPNVAFCRALDQIRDLKAAGGGGFCESSKMAGNLVESQLKADADISHNNPEIGDATSIQEDQLQVGDRVFCIWDSDGLYYPGRIGAVYSATQTGASSAQAEGKQSTVYKIDYEDGDTRWAAPRSDILTVEEAASIDLVVTEAVSGQKNQRTEEKHHRVIERPQRALVEKEGQPYRRPNKKKKHA